MQLVPRGTPGAIPLKEALNLRLREAGLLRGPSPSPDAARHRRYYLHHQAEIREKARVRYHRKKGGFRKV